MTPSLRGYYDKMLGVESEEAGVELPPEERTRRQEQLIILNRMEAKIFEAQHNALREISGLSGGRGDGEGQLAVDAAADFTPGQVRTEEEEPKEPREQEREETPLGWGARQRNADEERRAAFGLAADARAPEFEGQQAALGQASPEMEAARQQFEEARAPEFEGQQAALRQASPEMEAASQQFEGGEHRIAEATAQAQAQEEVRQDSAEARALGEAGSFPELEAEIERLPIAVSSKRSNPSLPSY